MQKRTGIGNTEKKEKEENDVGLNGLGKKGS